MLNNEHASLYTADDQVRRPLVVRIAQDLRLQYLTWTEEEVLAEARAQTVAQLQWKERMAA